MRGEARERQERRAPFTEKDGRFAGIERQELAEAVHTGRPLPERVPELDDLLGAYFARWGR